MKVTYLIFITLLQFFVGCFQKHSKEDPALLSLQQDSVKSTQSPLQQDSIKSTHSPLQQDSVKATYSPSNKTLPVPIVVHDTLPSIEIKTSGVTPENIVNFAKTLVGIPYRYASTDPSKGFDCSGFITYVFNHFSIKVPRSSIDFTNVGKEIPVSQSKVGDIILFTGTDSTERFVGHMGIIVSNTEGEIEFIHSSSGKAYGVTITPLNPYYKGRFVKVIRIFLI